MQLLTGDNVLKASDLINEAVAVRIFDAVLVRSAFGGVVTCGFPEPGLKRQHAWESRHQFIHVS